MTDPENDTHLNNICDGLVRSEYRMRKFIEQETHPGIREILEEELECILKARDSHEYFAKMLP
ncbi:hypothetical protein [Komagataeibacter medellinensis]|uniref:hypothetical protein n=1 Tax=Komagataeibacter medellinensis TaxID=1177712 RepID=UPI0012972965|nr:hypothetical protein [Komagataeibacter medellinensis]